MYGDPAEIRRLATRMRERAGDLRRQGDRLVSAAEHAHWVSVSGSAMQQRARDRAADLAATAGAYEDAADKLDAHAKEVEQLIALIATIEKTVVGLISGAIDRVRDFAASVVDGARDLVGLGDDGPSERDKQLANYQAPPSGDKAWLDVPDDLGVRI